jgi:hypothetical protein
MADFVAAEGIFHEKTVPHEHHQNGAVERVNRTLSEMAQSLLHTKRLPAYLWLYAFRQAAYIFNRMVHWGHEVTPNERVLGVKPTLSMLQVFDCEAYMYDHNHKKQVVPYASKLHHIGVSPDAKGWLLWDKSAKKVHTAVSVQFNEANPIVECKEAEPGTGLEAPVSAIECLESKAVVSAIECLN